MKSATLLSLLVAVLTFGSWSRLHAIDTYIVAGQSNGWRLSQIAQMQGVPVEENADGPRIHYFGMDCVSQPDSSEMVTITVLNPAMRGTALARALLDRAGGEDIVLLQYCRCGAPVSEKKKNSWWPGKDPQSGDTYERGLFGAFTSYLTQARAQSQSLLGEDLEVKGLFWHQGESDVEADKAEFEKTVTDVFWRLREVVGNPELPIVAGHIRDLGDNSQGINTALDRVAERDPNLNTVPLIGVSFEPDREGKPDVHIATPGCQKLGRDMVESMTRLQAKDQPFRVYAPSRAGSNLWIVKATPAGNSLSLETVEKVDLGFTGATIAAHPFRPLLYVISNRAVDGVTPGAAIELDRSGSHENITPFSAANGYSYLSLDRTQSFLLGCNYGNGFVDVYELDDFGLVGARVSSLNEGRKAAHCVLPSPDNRSVYIPYVKDSNALYQYHFDAEGRTLD